jgi:hypothetical protein
MSLQSCTWVVLGFSTRHGHAMSDIKISDNTVTRVKLELESVSLDGRS